MQTLAATADSGVMDFSATAHAVVGSSTGYRRFYHAATCTASGYAGFCSCQYDRYSTPSSDFAIGQPEKRGKYDPFKARRMWAREALAETRRPQKRPSRQVQFNQVSRLRPVKPRYLSKKR